MTIEDLAKSEGIWNSEIKDNLDVVLKSSIKFFRNIEGYAFAHKLGKKDREKLNKLLIEDIQKNAYCTQFSIYRLSDFSYRDKKIFYERNIIRDDRADESIIVLSKNQNFYFIIGDRDHIEFVNMKPGFHFDDIYIYGKNVINEIENKLSFVFSQKHGYLNSQPNRCGSGMEIIITLHLAGLIISDRINEIAIKLEKNGLGLRGSWLEAYYEIYNKKSTGLVEKEVYENALSNFQKIIQNEREARKSIYNANKVLIEDRVWRSYGILLSSRLISLYEALDLLSYLRLGISLGIINYLTIKNINLLLYYIQDFHLRKIYNIEDENKNLEEVRAQFLRDYLKEVI